MFVQDFMIVECSARAVVAELRAGGRAFLGEAVAVAGAGLEDLRVKVGPERWPALLAKTVEVTLGPVREHGEVTLIAFSWRATGLGSLFPLLDADLEVSPLGEDHCELALRGRYVPPGGTPGRMVDRLLLHRLADATVRAFLSHLALRLAAAAPA
ncbi:MAG TPA: hypothetical protein VED59_00385 [Acidimicrobiales bacterium]|nr:hypothetical protein [Acidimicrobiales bacterium]